MEYASAALSALRTALEREGVQGLEWEPAPLDTEHLPDLRHRASGAARVRFLVPYDDPHRLRTLVAHVLERGVWLDVSRLAIRPLGHLRAFACLMDLVFADPRIAFQSTLVRQRVAQARDLGRQYQAVAGALMGEFEKLTESLPEDRQRAFRGRLEAFLRCGGREEEAAEFESELDERVRPVMVDLRLYVDLPRSHRRMLEDLDRWIERERTLANDGMRGKTFYRQPWPAFVPSCGVHENPELRPGEPPKPPDPEALYRLIADESASLAERQDALFHLQTLRTDASRVFAVRAVGHDALRLNALEHALGLPVLAPLFREIVLAADSARAVSALDGLRDFDGDPLAAWRKAEGAAGGDARGDLYREAILAGYGRTGDRTIVPRLLEELRSERRTAGWITAALLALREFRAAEAAETVLPLARSRHPGIRLAALEYFEVADHPPAAPALFEALEAPDLEVAAAAERGLAGQRSQGWGPLLRALDRLHHRAIAIPARSADDAWRNRLGATLLRAVAALPGRCPEPELVRRSLRRIGADSVPGARRLVGDETRPLVRESELTGSTPEATLVDRMRLWAARGYAAARYRTDGHRDSSWDHLVERGHEEYDPESTEQSEEAARAFEESVRRGCRDGMVHYRLAVCRHTRGDLAGARRSYESALELLPERYPGSPYVLCAEAALGQMARNEGRPEEALDRYRRAVRSDMAVRDVREQIPDVEEELRSLRTDPSAPLLSVGRLLAIPGRRHPARVTSLEVSADGRAILSADEGGHVQISRIAEDLPPAVEPRARILAHDPGRTCAAWVVPLDRVFVTGGADGRIRRGRFQAGRPAEATTILEHGSPIDALARLSDGEVAFADAEGRVFVLELDRGKARPLLPAWRARVRALLSDAGRLVAVDEAHGVQVWTLPAEGPTEWAHRVGKEILFADMCSSGLLYVGTSGESVRTYRLETGHPGRMLAVPPGGSTARFGRFDVRSGVAVWGYASGSVRVESGEGGEHVATEPLAAMDVSFDHRLLAYADAYGFLHVRTFGR